jgi:hypothetical protein
MKAPANNPDRKTALLPTPPGPPAVVEEEMKTQPPLLISTLVAKGENETPEGTFTSVNPLAASPRLLQAAMHPSPG